jgi:hypothetical protein
MANGKDASAIGDERKLSISTSTQSQRIEVDDKCTKIVQSRPMPDAIT